jgi:hypothetical protein
LSEVGVSFLAKQDHVKAHKPKTIRSGRKVFDTKKKERKRKKKIITTLFHLHRPRAAHEFCSNLMLVRAKSFGANTEYSSKV